MKLKKIDTIIFDMDGTIADLYNYENWLPMLRGEKNIFDKIPPMIDINELNGLLLALKNFYDIRIITWLPLGATKEYKKVCRKDKNLWLKQYALPVTVVHAIQYGAKKHLVKGISKNALLFDDNKQVRKEWVASGRLAFDEKNIINELHQLLKLKRET